MDGAVSLGRMVVAANLPVFVGDLRPLQAQLDLARTAIDELRAQYPESTPSNVQARYMSPWKSHGLSPKLTPLCHSVLRVATTCADTIHAPGFASLNLQLAVVDCWGAIYEPGDHARLHNHFPADFSAVVFLESEGDGAPLLLGNGQAVPPTPGTLVLFPGVLDHEVPPTSGRRVVIAMNLYKQATFSS